MPGVKFFQAPTMNFGQQRGTALQNQLGQLRVQQAQQQQQDQNRLRELRQQALGGDQQALQEMGAINPAEMATTFKMIEAMDEKTRRENRLKNARALQLLEGVNDPISFEIALQTGERMGMDPQTINQLRQTGFHPSLVNALRARASTNEQIFKRFDLITKAQAAANKPQRFGNEREALSMEHFNKPFAQLSQEQRRVVNKAAQKGKVGRTKIDALVQGNLPKSILEESQGKVLKFQSALDLIDEAEKLVKDNPRIVGLPGKAKGILGTVVGTAADVLGDTTLGRAAKEGEKELDAVPIQRLETVSRLLVGQLKPVVANETGKFTDNEQKEAKRVVKTLETATTQTQVLTALDEARRIIGIMEAKEQSVVRSGKLPQSPAPKQPQQIYQNPQTGQEIIFKDGKWVDIKTGEVVQ